ncbi:MAG: SGNH/GDSL hydrolase family protein [Lachnospiraceae bacterium]|nr:SGNH/GDSL hydrolase family protein [Lachnospiraceae bacterium]
MKQGIKFFLSAVIVAGLVFIGLDYVAKVTERKDSVNKYAEFYDQETDFDVLFLGQSRVLNSVFPMELWREYGIVSYNLAGHGNTIPTNYWLLMSALEETTPKLVVLDCGLVKEQNKVNTVEQLHLSVDHIPYGETKTAMINDLLGESEQKWDFLWKFSTYHNRWSEVTAADFNPQPNVEKGAESRIGVTAPEGHLDFGTEDKIQGKTTGMEYLVKIIEECQARDIEILLTYIPFPDPSGWQLESNAVWDIAKEYEVNYLDFHTLFPVINLETDCYDSNAHLNPSGGWKLTSYLGQYIADNYGIEDRREDPLYKDWHEDYEAYRQYKLNNRPLVEELQSYLMLLYDQELSFGIWLEPGADWLDNMTIRELLANIGIEADSYKEGNVFLLVDRKKGRITDIPEGGEQNTGLGTFGMRINFDTAAMIVDWNDKEYAFDKEAAAGILVFDKETGEILDFAQFVVNSVESSRITST